MRRKTTTLRRSNQKRREERERCPRGKVKKVFQEERNDLRTENWSLDLLPCRLSLKMSSTESQKRVPNWNEFRREWEKKWRQRVEKGLL